MDHVCQYFKNINMIEPQEPRHIRNVYMFEVFPILEWNIKIAKDVCASLRANA